MHTHTAWDMLPPGVVSKILWSEVLQLSDRLRCQEVCTAWRKLLEQAPSTSMKTATMCDLVVELRRWHRQQSTALWCNGTPPRLIVWGIDGVSRDSYSACRHWLTLKTPLLQRIQLVGKDPQAWQLRDLFSVFQSPILHSPPVLQVKLTAEICSLLDVVDLLTCTLVDLDLRFYVQDFHMVSKVLTMTCLTRLSLNGMAVVGAELVQPGKLLTELQALPSLHTIKLKGFQEPQLISGSLHYLRKLTLKTCAMRVCDLRSFTQLTSLNLDLEYSKPEQVMLPVGDPVLLQRLVIMGSKPHGMLQVQNMWAATQLTSLELSTCEVANLHLESLQALRSLLLKDVHMIVHDLSSCTQLTRVMIWWGETISREVKLPIGSTVQLQHLVIFACDNPDYFGVLHNLAYASQLTYLEFSNTYPESLGQHGWPESMPSLQVFIANHIPEAPPGELVGYTNLQQLELDCYVKYHYSAREPQLPQWSSQLTRLTKLHTLSICGQLQRFPKFVLQLEQLQNLDLSGNRFEDIGLPVEISQFTEFSALKHLDLRMSKTAFTSRWKSLHNRWSPSEYVKQLDILSEQLGPGVVQY